MAVLGSWNSIELKRSTLRSAAVSSAVFMRLVLEPNVQELSESENLSEETKERLNDILLMQPFDDRYVSVKIWKTDNTVAYSTNSDLEGQHFLLPDVLGAMAGEVVVSYDELEKADNAHERSMSIHLLEIAAPLYEEGTDRVIAVGEYYENADWFEEQLNQTLVVTWLVVGATMLTTLALLFIIVRRGSGTIERQQAELNNRMSQAETMAAQNEQLRAAAEMARLDASDANEQLLTHIGSELHDGPIQLLSIVRLKMSVFRRALRKAGHGDDPTLSTDGMEQISVDVLNDLRNLSVGLILPEIESISLSETLNLAVQRHCLATGAVVKTDIVVPDIAVSRALKTCVYRIAQEGLSNAHKHAGGATATVSASSSQNTLTIVVADDGPGFDRDLVPNGRQKLGMVGLRNRVSAAKGTLRIHSEKGEGTKLIVDLPLDL